MAAQLNIGDVVELRSGGPTMTVTKNGKEGWVYCQWFTPEGQRQENTFQVATLKVHEMQK